MYRRTHLGAGLSTGIRLEDEELMGREEGKKRASTRQKEKFQADVTRIFRGGD